MNIKAKIISPLEKVFYDQKLSSFKEYKQSSSLLGEKHSFCVAYMNEDYATTHYAICSVKFNIKSDIKKHISLYQIEHVPGVFCTPMYEQDDPNFLRRYPGLFPDVLMPAKLNYEYPIVERILNSLWVEIDTTSVPAGKHDITIEFLDPDGKLLCACKHTLNCINATLPPHDMIITQWFHTDCIADFYKTKVFSAKHWKAIESFMQAFVQGGNTMIYTPLFTPPLDTAVGGERTTTQLVDIEIIDEKYSFCFDKLEKWVTLAKKCGIKYFEMSHLFTQWGAFHAPKIVAKKNGKLIKIFGWDTDSHGKEYEDFLAVFLDALQKELVKLDINNCSFFHISDEPATEHIESYERCSVIIRKYLKGYKIMDAMMTPEFVNKNLMDIPVPGLYNANLFFDAGIRPRFVYYCGAPSNTTGRSLSMPSFKNRIIGALFYSFDIDGFLHWGFNFYNSCKSTKKIDPFFVTDADKRFCSGDSFLVYPGDDLKPIWSLRYAVFRDGLQDLRALKLCEELYGKEAVKTVLEELNCKEPLSITSVPTNPDYTLLLREIINNMIAEKLN